jgi:hypothetical protein
MQHQPVLGETVQQAYVRMLEPYNFTWFCTFTFKDEKHPEAADKAFRVWINTLNRELYGKRWKNRIPGGVLWVRALEWQKRDVVHYHALVVGVPTDRDESIRLAQRYQRVWLVDLECGFARLDIIDDRQTAVHKYVSKYTSKGGEIDFSHNFGRSTHDYLHRVSAA